MCADESSDPEGPFFFIYSTVFWRLGLRLPFTPFERALLTKVNVAPAQLYPNNWAFMRAFEILYHCLGHTPSVDVFLFFFEAKSLGKKLWVSFNGVAGRVLLSQFQQSYKGFKKHFFKVRCNRKDPTLLDGFPPYWAKKPNLQKPRCLEDLLPQEREVCDLLSGLHTPFSTLELLKLEFRPKALKSYISTFFIFDLSLPTPLLALLFSLACHDPLLFVQTWALTRIRRKSWSSCLLSAKRPLLVWALHHSQLLHLLPFLPPTPLNQPLLTIGRKGWWQWLSIQRTRTPARASSSRGKGWAKPWRPLTLRLVGSLPPSGITPQVVPPRVTLLFMKVGGRVPLEARNARLAG